MMTGEQYRASLRDGRATYFEGERIDDITAHPMLGQTVASAAAGYDRFYDPTPDAIGAFMMVPGECPAAGVSGCCGSAVISAWDGPRVGR